MRDYTCKYCRMKDLQIENIKHFEMAYCNGTTRFFFFFFHRSSSLKNYTRGMKNTSLSCISFFFLLSHQFNYETSSTNEYTYSVARPSYISISFSYCCASILMRKERHYNRMNFNAAPTLFWAIRHIAGIDRKTNGELRRTIETLRSFLI